MSEEAQHIKELASAIARINEHTLFLSRNSIEVKFNIICQNQFGFPAREELSATFKKLLKP